MNQNFSSTRVRALLAAAALISLGACAQDSASSSAATGADAAADAQKTIATNTTPAEPVTMLQMIDTVEGDGPTAEAGKNIVVHYTGWLYDPAQPDNKGKKFDSSVDRGQPFVFPLGAGRVIQGWDQGFAGMQVGGKRTLVIPSEMGYGARGAGADIPPNATLVFEVELLAIQ
jgi:FKBP-type peptidyl-prolyl cis-trans isomerase FkpA